MSWRELKARVRGSLEQASLERQMDVEMRFHVDQATERNLRAGMTPAEARRQALLAFGAVDAFREEARGAHRARTLENVVADVRFTVRSLVKSPSFTIAALLTVALGIGASTAVFSVVNAALLRPLPFADASNITYVGWNWGDGRTIQALSGFQFEFVRAHTRSLSAVTTFRGVEEYIGDESDSTPVRGLRVSHDFFRVIGMTPAMGREFNTSEVDPGGALVVVLSHALWSGRFGGDSSIVGKQVRIAGEPHTVIGIMPASFSFPPNADYTGYIVPMRLEPRIGDEGHNYTALARARADWSPQQRIADVQSLTTAFRAQHPELAEVSESFQLFTHADVHAGAIRRTLWILFGAVSLVLLIACANTATLLLVRASGRQRELAVRAAIGAGRRRILQQLLTEGLVLSLLAAVLGVMLALAAMRALLAFSPGTMFTTAPVTLDARVLGFAVVVTVLTGTVFGLAAALPVLGLRLQHALLGSARVVGNGGMRTRELLVLLQTTVAVVLLVAAAFVATGFTRLIRIDPGFEPEPVTAVRLGRLPPDYTPEVRDELADRLLLRLRSLAAVRAATAASNLPLERGMNFPIDIAERPELGIGDVELRFVAADYFKTLGVPLRIGRDFNLDDTGTTEYVAIVNEAFARHYWSEGSPIGRAIQIGHLKGRWLQPGLERQTRVVGLVGNMREIGLDRDPKPTVYVPRTQLSEGIPLLLVRGEPSEALLQALRAVVTAEEPRLAPEIERLSTVVSRSVATPRFRALLLLAFAAAALLLAAVGIYGVNAAVVQQRRRELGLRMALGATRGGLAFAVVRRCLSFVLAGAMAGFICSLATRRLLSSMLYGLSANDPLILASVCGILVVVAAAASYIPARRAANVDPARSLRAD